VKSNWIRAGLWTKTTGDGDVDAERMYGAAARTLELTTGVVQLPNVQARSR